MSRTYDTDSVDAMEPTVLPPGVFDSDEFIEAETSTLLHPFEDEAEIHREFNTQFFVSFQNVEPSQDRALVIGRTAPNELTVIRNDQGKRIGVPPIALESL